MQRKLNIPARGLILTEKVDKAAQPCRRLATGALIPLPERYRAYNDMDERGGEQTGGEQGGRGENPLGDLAQILVENPWMHQALHLAFGVRERASEAGTAVIRNLNLPTGQDVDRITRRLRGLSERLEELEDEVDRLSRAVGELRREREAPQPGTSAQG
jgi:hypothetical protein